MKFEVKMPIHLIVEADEDKITISRRRALDDEDFEPTTIDMNKVVEVSFAQAGSLAPGHMKFEYKKLTPLTNKFNFTEEDNEDMIELKEYVEKLIENR
ncbi:MAG: hypothetical protein Q4P31_03000 [Andreesenia angusta]|nr:hypothetical protein [Andreesenia angusta]